MNYPKGLIFGRDVFVLKEVGMYKKTTCKNQDCDLKHGDMNCTAVLVNVSVQVLPNQCARLLAVTKINGISQ